MSLIRASGMHGTPESCLSPEMILNLGKTIGSQYKNVTVSRDLHPSSPMVFNVLISGLMAAGASVKNAGTVPAPVLPFAANKTSCSLMIGTDMRETVAGVGLWNPDGVAFTNAQMRSVEMRFDGEKTLPSNINVGNIREVTGTIENYRNRVVSNIGSTDCQVVIDCASDCTSFVAPQLITDIGADAITLNCHGDGRSPGRPNSLDEISLRNLGKTVKANFGSIGVALNNDGTRIAAFDETGRYLSGDSLLALFTHFLQPKTMTLPIDASMLIDDLSDGTIFRVPINRMSLGEGVKVNNTEFGGCADGSFVFPKNSFCLDGMAAAALLSKIAGEESLSSTFDGFPKYSLEHNSLKYADARENIDKRLHERLMGLEYERFYDADGYRVEFDAGWFLVRFSDIENKIDITVEGRDKVYVLSLMEIANKIVAECMKPVTL